MNSEVWKEICGFDGNYLVSNYGRVKSTFKVIERSDGTSHTRVSKVLKPATDARGYLRVAMSHKGRLITKKVHRLVAIAFIENKLNYPQVNHIDCNKKNNHFSNLEWVTNSQNIKHAIDNGLIKMQYSSEERRQHVNTTVKKGSLNGFSKLTEDQVREIRRDYIPFKVTRKMLADKYGVDFTTIKDVVNNRRWKHVK